MENLIETLIHNEYLFVYGKIKNQGYDTSKNKRQLLLKQVFCFIMLSNLERTKPEIQKM